MYFALILCWAQRLQGNRLVAPKCLPHISEPARSYWELFSTSYAAYDQTFWYDSRLNSQLKKGVQEVSAMPILNMHSVETLFGMKFQHLHCSNMNYAPYALPEESP